MAIATTIWIKAGPGGGGANTGGLGGAGGTGCPGYAVITTQGYSSGL
ncbi:MAG: hypothetical protein P4L83_21760 [Nevskia sp.]|nr:hypothetical protein [Nevskia sp.]